MAEHLTHRFEFLEEQLKRLDKVGFSLSEAPPSTAQLAPGASTNDDVTAASPDASWSYGSEGSELPNERNRRQEATLTATEACSAALALPQTTSSGQVTGHGRAGPFSRLARLAKTQGNSSVVSANCDDRHRATIQECREEVTMLVEEAVGGAERQLRRIVEQIVVRFRADVERALQKSAVVIASRAVLSLEQEIQIATQRSLCAGPAPMKSNAAGGTAEASPCEHNKGIILSPGLYLEIEQAERELSTAVDAVRGNSTALLTSLDACLQATLRAFEESTAKQLAVSFQKTVRERLEWELEELRKHDGAPNRQDVAYKDAPHRPNREQSPVYPTVGPSTPTFVAAGDPKPDKNSSNASGHIESKSVQEARRPRKRQPTWRILGLS